MSHSIQNYLISAITATVLDEMKDDVQTAPFFALHVDETTDMSCHVQLSVIIQYVDTAGQIHEGLDRIFLMSQEGEMPSLSLLF